MPLLSVQPSPPIAGVWKITETWRDMLALFQDKDLYASEIDKIQADSRKREWLAVRLLVKHLTGRELPISYRSNGAPFLSGQPDHISISHTKGYAAVILSETPLPGIDIEYRSERAWKLRAKYLSDNEIEQCKMIASCQTDPLLSPAQETLATLYWCAKETAYKALQASGVDFIKHLYLEPFPLSATGVFALKATLSASTSTYTIHYQITEDYILTWKA